VQPKESLIMIKHTAKTKLCALLTILLLLANSSGACAAAAPTDEQQKIEELLRLLQIQAEQLQQQQQTLAAQAQQFIDYQRKTEMVLQHQQASIAELQARLGGVSANSTEATAPTTAGGDPEKEQTNQIQPVGQPPAPKQKYRLEETTAAMDQPGVLTTKGQLVLEPSLQYYHLSNNRVYLHGYTIIPAITIGLIDIYATSRDTFISALSARYGLTNRLEAEIKVPYIYRTEENSTSPLATETNIDTSTAEGYGLGDIEFGLRYQLNQPQTGPYYIAGLRVKTDTGSDPFTVSRDPDTQLPSELATGAGFWGIQGSFTALFPSDPAVFYGGISYLWNIKRNVGTANGIYYGNFDPGDAIGFNLGMGFSLNEKASFSLGYEHSILTKNKRDGEVLPDQVTLHVGTFQLGYSYRLNKRTNINVGLGIGATESSSDVQLSLKVPMTF